ncbi:hypothetical protein [Janthinobacterium fluminis]|uniref:Uncharacterized protein n=1 Tax=Janthinobacterium fluminis TaxID=2987524 RepID=A0ABT5JV32_9BURK|nr:hypothetical protein [Janthinobacterium fluminis]MDC8756351.1 hypothetical protein [Janthinobacterium fluminis]
MNDLLQSGATALAAGIGDNLGQYAGSLFLRVSPWALLYGLLGLLASLPLLVYLARKGLLSRKPRPWNVLAKLSYLVILVAFTAGGAALGMLSRTHGMLSEGLTAAVQPAIEAHMPALRTYVTAQVAVYGPDQVITAKDLVEPLLKRLYYVPKSDSLWERGKAGAVNWIVLNYGAAALTEALQKTLIGKIEALSTAAKMDLRGQERGELSKLASDVVARLATDSARQLDFTKLDKTLPQILVRALQKNLDGHFSSMYAGVGIAFVLLGLLIGGEMLLYFRWYLRRAV